MAKRELPSQEFVEQRITQQVTITAGSNSRVSIDIPKDKAVFLKGYGYTWFTANKFSLSTGNTGFPTRTDQEGSPAIPAIFGTPFKVRSGGKLSLTIYNNDASSHTYDVVFYILTTELLEVESTGGDLNFTIGGASGTSTKVSITDSTGTTAADVVVRGDGKNALVVDTELTIDSATLNIENVFVASTDGLVTGAAYMLIDSNNRLQVISGESRTPTHTAVSVNNTTTIAHAAAATRKAIILINDSDETIYLKIGVAAVMNEGIRLNANGGSYEMSKELGNLSTDAINAISASGTKNLMITEFI